MRISYEIVDGASRRGVTNLAFARKIVRRIAEAERHGGASVHGSAEEGYLIEQDGLIREVAVVHAHSESVYRRGRKLGEHPARAKLTGREEGR